MATSKQVFRVGGGPAFYTQGGYLGFPANLASRPHINWTTVGSIAYMSSFNHRWNPNRGFQGDQGGPWLAEDYTVSFQPTVLDQYGPVSAGQGNCGRNAYTASANVVSLANTSIPTTTAAAKAKVEAQTGTPDYADLNSKGSTAIARCEPTRPSADMSTAIAELVHDGIPSMPGRAEGNIGNEYLNLQFGWSPTISDGRNFIAQIRSNDARNLQYARDSGKLVRRRYEFPRSISSTTTTTNSVYPGYWGSGPSADICHVGTKVTTVTTDTRTWFSGAFTYHIPKSALGRTVRYLDKKYGLLPGIDTAWQLTPYSWLVDWFSNAGDVIHNLNAFTENGLVLAYGYVMRETVVTTDSSWVGPLRDIKGVFHTYTLTDQIQKRSRVRVQATPYGFGLSWDGFNPFQLSILAALGISRAL